MAYELWKKVETIGDSDYTKTPYAWMAWLVGPITGGEEWFDTEDEARAWIAERTPTEEAA